MDAPLTNGTALVNAAGIGCDQAAATAQTTTVVASSPQLSVQKVATPAGTVAAGKQIAYHFAYSNTGTDAATAALVAETDNIVRGAQTD